MDETEGYLKNCSIAYNHYETMIEHAIKLLQEIALTPSGDLGFSLPLSFSHENCDGEIFHIKIEQEYKGVKTTEEKEERKWANEQKN